MNSSVRGQERKNNAVVYQPSAAESTDTYKDVEFILNSSAKIYTCFNKQDFDLFNADDEMLKSFRPFERKKHKTLCNLYAFAERKYRFDNDNRWLMLFNILMAMRKKSQEFFTDTHTIIKVGKGDTNKFISYLQTEWNNTWADYQGFDNDSQIVFTNLYKGRRTENKTVINFNEILDLSFEFMTWTDIISVCIKTPDIDYIISFSGLNSIIEPLIIKDGENNNEQLN